MCKIEQVPTILSSLCQEILRNGLKVDFLFMTIPHDFQRYESVKSELSNNISHSYEDVYITVKLLQSFLEELPEPLVLYSLYSQAINFSAYLFNQAVEQLCNKHAIYKSLVQFTQVECYEDIWEYLWKPIQADNGKPEQYAYWNNYPIIAFIPYACFYALFHWKQPGQSLFVITMQKRCRPGVLNQYSLGKSTQTTPLIRLC